MYVCENTLFPSLTPSLPSMTPVQLGGEVNASGRQKHKTQPKRHWKGNDNSWKLKFYNET